MSEKYQVTEHTALYGQIKTVHITRGFVTNCLWTVKEHATGSNVTKRNVGGSQNRSGRRGGQKDLRCVGESNPDSPVGESNPDSPIA